MKRGAAMQTILIWGHVDVNFEFVLVSVINDSSKSLYQNQSSFQHFLFTWWCPLSLPMISMAASFSMLYLL